MVAEAIKSDTVEAVNGFALPLQSRALTHLLGMPESEADIWIEAGTRVALCWPSANRDEGAFRDPDEVVLDRKPNPHVGFGFGPHNCLGAPHARLIIRSLLKSLCDQVQGIELLSTKPLMETESSYTRQVGYESVQVRFIGK